MSPQTKKLLEDFAAKAHWSEVGHPVDMERFRDFVIAAYRNGDESITLDEFLEIVSTHENGESVHDAKKRLNLEMYLFGIYEDGVKLLRRFEEK